MSKNLPVLKEKKIRVGGNCSFCNHPERHLYEIKYKSGEMKVPDISNSINSSKNDAVIHRTQIYRHFSDNHCLLTTEEALRLSRQSKVKEAKKETVAFDESMSVDVGVNLKKMLWEKEQEKERVKSSDGLSEDKRIDLIDKLDTSILRIQKQYSDYEKDMSSRKKEDTVITCVEFVVVSEDGSVPLGSYEGLGDRG